MTDKIPEFDENGLLPVGDYEVTLAELRTSILVQGPRDRIKYPSWDAIDGYFVCDVVEIASGRLVRALNRLDPQKVWTWDPALRRHYPGYPKKNFQCGMFIASSYTRISLDLIPGFGTSSETSLNSRPLSDSVAATQRPKELSN